MRLSDLQFEFAHDSILLELWMIRQGYKFTYGEVWRSDDTQALYFEKGLSNIEGRGPHGDRLAKDYNVWVNGVLTYDKALLKPIGEHWKSLHPLNRWGGDFMVGGKENRTWDSGHIERRQK